MSEPLRIAVLHPHAWPTIRRGGERYYYELVQFLRADGHEVEAITGGGETAVVDLGARGRDVTVKYLRSVRIAGVRPSRVETFGIGILPRLLRRRYDIVHATVPSAAIAARAAGHRVVYTILGHPDPEVIRASGYRGRLMAAAVRTSHVTTVLSRDAEEAAGEAFGCDPPVVLAPGVDLARLQPADRTSPPTVLFASAMRPEKGLAHLLEAFVLATATLPELRLCLSGPGDPGWAFDEVGAALEPVLDRIDVVGAGTPEELLARYARAHVTVLPSQNEAFGLVLAESLGSGTPVVGSTAGGARDIVADDVGLLVPFGDSVALASAILDAVDLAREPGTAAACRERAQAWDWTEQIGPAHVALYRSTVATTTSLRT